MVSGWRLFGQWILPIIFDDEFGEASRLCDQRKSSRWLAHPFITGLALIVLLVAVGCDRPQNQSANKDPDSVDALQQMRGAVSRGQWQTAWHLSSDVLTQHHSNAEVIQLVASVAQEIGKGDVAADLMVDACRAESLGNPLRLQQAAKTLLNVGRLYDCMDLLEESLEVAPEQHQIRHSFYNMCWGAENRLRAIPHGRLLVRQRQFDLRLLLSLSYTESGTDRLESLVEMAERFPQDQRPLVAQAKYLFDEGKFDQAGVVLRKVLEMHPEHLPAINLLSQVLAASESDDDEFVALVVGAAEGIKDYPGYWLAMGDWCWSRQLDRQAVRAYWEATRRDPDGKESWVKLASSLKQIDKIELELDQAVVKAIQDRVTLLAQLSDATTRVRYDPTQAIAVEIAESLKSLGRLWEAEAWASIAMQFPADQSVQIKQVRESIVASMSQQTPWQVAGQHPELTIDLTDLPLPKIGPDKIATIKRSVIPRIRKIGRIALANEAGERALDFFGRTGEDLDQPGISFHETLGCGGGAIDFDLDGWSDLYFAAAGGTPPHHDSQSNSLWRNLDGLFADVTEDSGTSDTGFGQGIAVGDVNEDGFPDLLALNYGLNTLLINNGDGTFTNANDRLDQTDRGLDWSSSGAFADFDQDGLTDLIVLSYGNDLEPVTRVCRDGKLVKACGPLTFKASPDRFLQNTATGGLVDQTRTWGIPENPGRGLGVVVGSFDRAPGVDIFIANDQSSNHYWNRSGQAKPLFRESAIVKGLGSNHGAPYQGSMGIAAGDFDRDGDFDFYVTNFDKECNTFHDQVNDGVWRDQTVSLKLYSPTLPVVGFGTEAVDLDNDGVLEIVVVNGHVDASYPGDASAPHAQLPQVFRRDSNGSFESIGESIEGDYLSRNHVGRALWTLDINRDGLTDFAVTHQTESVALLVNRTEESGNWIGLQLSGQKCSRDAVGAIIEVRSGDQTWVETQTSGDGYLCSNERLLRIGLGELSGRCSVTIKWPLGNQQSFSDLKPNAHWLLVEGHSQAFEMLGAKETTSRIDHRMRKPPAE